MDSTLLGAWIAAGVSVVVLLIQLRANKEIEEVKANLAAVSNREHYRFTKYHEIQLESIKSIASLFLDIYNDFHDLESYLSKLNPDFGMAAKSRERFDLELDRATSQISLAALFLDEELLKAVTETFKLYREFDAHARMAIKDRRYDPSDIPRVDGKSLWRRIRMQHHVMFVELRSRAKKLLVQEA